MYSFDCRVHCVLPYLQSIPLAPEVSTAVFVFQISVPVKKNHKTALTFEKSHKLKHLDTSGYTLTYGCGLGKLLLRVFPLSSLHKAFSRFGRYSTSVSHIDFFSMILGRRILYGIDISILNVLNFLFHSCQKPPRVFSKCVCQTFTNCTLGGFLM